MLIGCRVSLNRHMYSSDMENLWKMFFSSMATYRKKFVDIGANLTDRVFNGFYHGSAKHKDDLQIVLKRAVNVGIEKIIVTSGLFLFSSFLRLIDVRLIAHRKN